MTYIKRGASLIAAFLVAVSIVFAAHSASVTTDYVPIYETTSANFSLTVSNGILSANSINNVTAFLNGFNLLSTFYLVGWQSASSGNMLSFFTSDHKISNWGAQTFGFEIKANNVDSNQTFEWQVATQDTAGDSDTDVLQLLVLNDYTAPIISNVLPQNGSFIKKGTTSQQFSFDAIDPETGVSETSGSYGICDNLSNVLSFAKTNDSYLATSDLSGYDDSTVLCYEYNAKNNGGETAAAGGQFTIDGVAPQVQLISPDNGVFMNSNSLFQFSATDNLAPTLSCSLYADSNLVDSIVINNGDAANVSASEMPEGQHSWNVTCSDLAGNVGASETRTFTLDKTPPAINVTSPASGAVNKAGVPVEVAVTDNYNVATIWYEFQSQVYENITSPFSINTENATDGENLIIIHATDVAGNEAVLNYTMIVDKKAPTIDLTFPEENSTVDVHVPFVLTVTDNYDPLLDCYVIVDGDLTANFTAENGNVTQVTVIIGVGNRTVRVQCKDDADNAEQTQDILIDVQDMSGPDILIDEITDIMRGETAVFRADITDISGVDSVDALLTLPDGSSETVSLNKNGNIFTGQYPTGLNSQLGEYTLTIAANDTLGNSNDASQTFHVIHAYVVTLDVNGPVYEKQQVTATGTAQRDDGDPIPGNEVNLVLPKENRTLDLSNNSFSTTFNAPSKGNYQIKAWIVIGNREFNATKTLQVKAKSNNGNGGNSGGGHTTTVMPEGNAGIIEPECETDSDCDIGEICEDGTCISVPKEVVIETEKLEPAPAEPGINPNAAVNVTEKWRGVGKASGFLNLGNINWTSLLWIIFAIVVVALLIKLMSGKGGKERRGISYSYLDKYLAERRRKE